MKLKRLFQVRIRTLLLLMAGCGVALTGWDHFVQRYINQEEATNHFAGLAGRLVAEAAKPAWLESLVGEERYHQVVECHLEDCKVDSESLAPIASMPWLKRLYLNRTHVGDEGMRYVGTLKRLERLSLWHTHVADEGLAHVAKCKELSVLDLHRTCVSDEGLELLLPLVNLKFLKLGGPIHGPGLRFVAQLPNLRKLDLTASRVDYDALEHLEGSTVEELAFARTLPASVVPHLSQLPQLRTIGGKIVQASDTSVSDLLACGLLRELDISGLGITDEAARLTQGFSELRELRLHGDLTDRALDHVAATKQLQEVHLVGRFSREAIEELARKRPSLSGSIRTLLRSEEYEAVTRAGHLNIKPLIQLGKSRNGSRTSRRLRLHPKLHAWVTWPATLRDAAELDEQGDRIVSIELEDPDSLREYTYHADWALDGIAEFPKLLSLRVSRVNQDELSRLGEAAALRELVLRDSRLTDAELHQLKLPDSLEKLYIVPSYVTPAGMDLLRERYPGVIMRENGHGTIFSNSRWQSAWVGQGSIDRISRMQHVRSVQLHGFRAPLDLDPLADLRQLEELEIAGPLAREPLWRLTRPLPSLRQLSLPGLGVTDRHLQQLKHSPKLEQLWMTDASISDNGLKQLVHTPNLRVLSLRRTWNRAIAPGPWITGRGFEWLAKYCPQLETLDLRGTSVQEKHFVYLTDLKQLSTIKLDSTRVGDETCRHLSQLPALSHLRLQYTRVGDEGLAYLAGCQALEYLYIGSTDTTEAGRERLRELRPEMAVRD